MTISNRYYMVGGAVRDMLLGVKSKDIDFAVEAESFSAMRDELVELGFKIFLETPRYFTIRARFPENASILGRFADMPLDGQTADFVLCRKDGAYSDARHPDSVEVGTIEDDLARRDFTVNAIALRPNGTMFSTHNGILDLDRGILRAVGMPLARIREDPLRAYRAFRFSITKKLEVESELYTVISTHWMEDLLPTISADRIRDELTRAFKFDPIESLRQLIKYYPNLLEAAVDKDIWFKPTSEER